MAEPLQKGDRIIGITQEGSNVNVDLVVTENRPRAHGYGMPIWMAGAVMVKVRRHVADDDVIDPTFGTVASSKRLGEEESLSGHPSFPSAFYRLRRAQMGDREETIGKFEYRADSPSGGPAYYVAEVRLNSDTANSR